MTSTADLEQPLTTTPDQYRLDWPRAWRAVKRLVADKDDTQQVFEVMDALSGRTAPKGYIRLLATRAGGRIAYDRVELAERFADRDWLASLPAESVGAAYLRFTDAANISAEGLADESRKVDGTRIDSQHPYAWYGRRVRDIHDVWHVLTGYSTDALGEACLVAFSYAQTKATGFALIAVAAANAIKKDLPREQVWAAVAQGWRNGRGAAWLPALDYEALMLEPLEAARARLNIPRPDKYLAIDQAARARAMTMAHA